MACEHAVMTGDSESRSERFRKFHAVVGIHVSVSSVYGCDKHVQGKLYFIGPVEP